MCETSKVKEYDVAEEEWWDSPTLSKLDMVYKENWEISNMFSIDIPDSEVKGVFKEKKSNVTENKVLTKGLT